MLCEVLKSKKIFCKCNTKNLFILILIQFILLLGANVRESNGQDITVDRSPINLSPAEGMECRLHIVPQRQSVQHISENCWETFRSLAGHLSSIRMNSMGLSKFCMEEFKFIRDIARDGSPKVTYKDVLVRCLTSRYDRYHSPKKYSWWPWG